MTLGDRYRLQSFSVQIFWGIVQQANDAIAHNAESDAQWFGITDAGKGWCPPPLVLHRHRRTWTHQTRPSGLALAHGIGVGLAYRNLADCQLIATPVACMEALPGLITHALRPRVIYKALMSYDNSQLAKDAGGFRWNRFIQGV